MQNVQPLFEKIVSEIPAPKVLDTPMQMLIVNVSYDNYKGQIAIGPLLSGVIRKNQQVMRVTATGENIPSRVVSVMTFDGLNRIEVEEAEAGDIGAIAGLENVKIGETIADFQNPIGLPAIKVEEPTVRMLFSVNTSPFYGREGQFVTANHIASRLAREILNDVALRVEPAAPESAFIVSGRGELHLAILIEKMRREGYEFQVAKPEVILKEENGQKMEPFEDVFFEVPQEYSGVVMQKMGLRHGELIEMTPVKNSVLMEFVISTKELFGYKSEFIIDTRGEGIISSSLLEYRKDSGNAFKREN